MKRDLLIGAYILGVLMLAAAAASGAANSTPPGSFVRTRVVSVRQLAQHVRKDPIVSARYARHFGMSAKDVAYYFENNLKLVSLKSPLRASVWYIGKSGSVKTKTKLLPKGTQVFSDRTGKPIIVWSCGNPLSKKLAVPKDQAKKPEPDKAQQEKVKAAPEETVGSEEPVREVQEPIAPAQSPGSIEVLLQPELETLPLLQPIIPPIEVTTISSPTIPRALPDGGSDMSWTSALAVGASLPIIGSIASGHGNTQGGGQSAVPELPGSLVLLAGAGAIGILRRYRSSRAK